MKSPTPVPLTRRVSERSAFTLTEVMMAAAVMVAGVVGMMQVITSGSEMLDVSRKQTIASQIIQSQIEQFRGSLSTDWAQFPGSGTVNLSTSSSYGSLATGFTCARTVANVKADGTLKKVTYTVTWTGITGRSYRRTGFTYVGKNGLNVAFQRS